MATTKDARQALVCKLCGKHGLTEIPKLDTLLGVTSDDRLWKESGSILFCSGCGHVQKMIDENWEQNATEVYSEYALYQSSGGAEHVVFHDSMPKPRSHFLLERLRDQIVIPEKGRMLDVGCGNGPLLRSFGKTFPQWSLVGFEPSERYRADVQCIPSVESFHSGTIAQIPGSFDLIALYYVLEHLPSPAQYIEELMGKLRPNGLLVVVVPNYLENPFDLLVIDHCSHFRADSLSFFMKNSGLDVLDASTEWIPRAIAAVGKNSASKRSIAIQKGEDIPAKVQESLDWLNRVANDARSRAKGGDFGIFGTATAGSWLAGVLGESVKFFVDEDSARTGPGKSHLGRPVYQPVNVPPHKPIYLALPPALAKILFDRLQPAYPELQFILPPSS